MKMTTAGFGNLMSGPVRSLNLATAVGIVLYEAIRATRMRARRG